jgi:hypothetical protein
VVSKPAVSTSRAFSAAVEQPGSKVEGSQAKGHYCDSRAAKPQLSGHYNDSMSTGLPLTDFRLASSSEVVAALGRRLRDQRMSRLMTQADLATRAGVALGAVKKLEATGKVTVETLVQVAGALGLVSEFNSIFAIRAQMSIADMERHELVHRKRVRKPSAGSKP